MYLLFQFEYFRLQFEYFRFQFEYFRFQFEYFRLQFEYFRFQFEYLLFHLEYFRFQFEYANITSLERKSLRAERRSDVTIEQLRVAVMRSATLQRGAATRGQYRCCFGAKENAQKLVHIFFSWCCRMLTYWIDRLGFARRGALGRGRLQNSRN